MNNKIKNILTLRNSILITLGLFCLITSFYLYGKNKSKVFKDEYMENIFIEEENSENNIKEETTESNIEKGVISTTKDIASENKMNIVVEIKGEVKKPDVYQINEGSIIKDLIDKAGGLTEYANIDSINRAEKLVDNQLIVIPNKDSDLNEAIITGGGNTSNDEVININSASISDLQKINGIGEVKAQSILDYREKIGGFKSIEDIKNVDGIGEKTFEKIKDKIKI